MSKIIDLSILCKEPLIFKDLQGEEYIIPGEVSTEFVIKLSHYNEKIKEVQDDEQSLNMMEQMVLDILSQDKAKQLTISDIKERFPYVSHLQIIIEESFKHIQEVANDPNLNSLQSTSTRKRAGGTTTKGKAK